MEQVIQAVFRAYDIRGIRQSEITGEFANLLGRALVARFKSERVVVGYDARPTSLEFAPHLIAGITEQGANVVNIGMVPTELVPMTAGIEGVNQAVIITASHNPPEYIGFKLLTDKGTQAIRDDNGRTEIKALMSDPSTIPTPKSTGKVIDFNPWNIYTDHLFKLVDPSHLQKPLRLLAEAGNGMGGAIVNHLIDRLPIQTTKLLFEPDGTYPSHTPNPHLPEARKIAIRAAKEKPHDISVLFDGDADRAAFLDELGEYVPSDYFDTLIMDEIIHPKNPDSPVVTDYRRGMTLDLSAKRHGYKVVRSKAGYPNIKKAMLDSKAVFGYEASAHTMYADTFYSESSGLTLLYILLLLNRTDKSFSELLAPYRSQIKMVDETNYIHPNSDDVFTTLSQYYHQYPLTYDDGLSIQAPDWHANVRKSGTESLVRLCLEATTEERLESTFQELDGLITQSGGVRVAH